MIADISGFTKLSEYFSTLGDVGVDKLSLILNQIFGHMVDTAEKWGGDVIKFAGDAVICFVRFTVLFPLYNMLLHDDQYIYIFMYAKHLMLRAKDYEDMVPFPVVRHTLLIFLILHCCLFIIQWRYTNAADVVKVQRHSTQSAMEMMDLMPSVIEATGEEMAKQLTLHIG